MNKPVIELGTANLPVNKMRHSMPSETAENNVEKDSTNKSKTPPDPANGEFTRAEKQQYSATTSGNLLPARQFSLAMDLSYLTIDNGITGAMSFLAPDDELICCPVPYRDLKKERLLDVVGNLALVRSMVEKAKAMNGKILAIFEQSPITPLFGAKNNYVNGRNNEFWRVLLTMEKVPFTWVNPRRWQKDVFRGIRGRDTKEMARLVVEQRFPTFRCNDLNKSQTEGVMDAICIAIWARENLR
jgi:hypothetical protein